MQPIFNSLNIVTILLTCYNTHMKHFSYFLFFMSISCTTIPTTRRSTPLNQISCANCNVLIFNFSSLTKEVFKQYNLSANDLLRFKNLENPIVFYNHFSTSNWPFQSLASIHTGLYVENHKVFNNEFHNQINYKKFNLEEDKLAEGSNTLLSQAQKSGYHTIFWGGEPHPSFYSTQTGITKGAAVLEKNCLHYPKQVEKLLTQIDSSPSKFFGVINIARTHFPHFVLPSDFHDETIPLPKSEFFPKNEEEYLFQRKTGWKKINEFLSNNPNAISDYQKEMKKTSRDAYWYLETARLLEGEQGNFIFKAHYQRAVLYSFAMIQNIVNHLQSTGKLANTIILITSDVGDNYLSNYKERGVSEKFSPFTYMLPSNESFGVPLFFYFPKKMNPPFFKNQNITNHTDLFPSLKYILNLEGSDQFDGFNFFADNFPERNFSHSFNFRPHSGIRLGFHSKEGSLMKHDTSKSIFFDYQSKNILSREFLQNSKNAMNLIKFSLDYDYLFKNEYLNLISEKVDNIYKD
jgi:hypothetical protein